MGDRIPDLVAELESLMPRLTRAVFPQDGANPLTQLPVGQVRMLRLLDGEAKLRVTHIASELRMTPSAVTQMGNRLEQLGLVERLDVAEDGRGRFLAISEIGRIALEERRRVRVEQAALILKDTHEETLEAFITALKSVLDQIPSSGHIECTTPANGGDSSTRSA